MPSRCQLMKNKIILMILLIVAVAIISVSIASCAGNMVPNPPSDGSDSITSTAQGSHTTEDHTYGDTASTVDSTTTDGFVEKTDTNPMQTTESTNTGTAPETDQTTDSDTFTEPNTDETTDTDHSSTSLVPDGSNTNHNTATDIHTDSAGTATDTSTETTTQDTSTDTTTQDTRTDTTTTDITSDHRSESSDKTSATITDPLTTDTNTNVSSDIGTSDRPSTDVSSTSTKTDAPSTDTVTSTSTNTTDKVTDTQTSTKPSTDSKTDTDKDNTTNSSDIYNQEGDALGEILKPAQITLLRPVASGILVKSNSFATIDYSNTKDGYVMVKYTAATSMKLKVQVIGPSNTTYTYNIKPLEWNVFPLSDGNGEYRILIAVNKSGSTYSLVLGQRINADMDNEFAPFLRPNQYVNYENATKTMNKAAQLVTGKDSLLDKVAAIYNYVTKNVTYDYEEAETVQSGYLPVLDEVLETKKGICFDYAALMTGMLRSQNIPCKLVVGYANKSYHAWISVWSADKGWVNGAIFFDGSDWKLMDPTFASTGGGSSNVVYTWKYVY